MFHGEEKNHHRKCAKKNGRKKKPTVIFSLRQGTEIYFERKSHDGMKNG